MDQSGMLHHAWNSSYVGLSFLVAALAAYIALELAGRAGQNFRNTANRFWLAAQALVLAYGIWATQFIGLLAARMEAAIGFNTALTVASGVVALLFVYPALRVLHGGPATLQRLLVAGGLAGLGVLISRAIGLYALAVPGTELELAWVPLIASVLLALATGVVALYFTRLLSGDWRRRQPHLRVLLTQFGGALATGGLLLATNLSAMNALRYKVTDELKLGTAASGADTGMLALVVGVASFLLLGLAVTSILMDAGRSGGDLDDLDFGDSTLGAPDLGPAPTAAD